MLGPLESYCSSSVFEAVVVDDAFIFVCPIPPSASRITAPIADATHSLKQIHEAFLPLKSKYYNNLDFRNRF
jgi:hypothetical protein